MAALFADTVRPNSLGRQSTKFRAFSLEDQAVPSSALAQVGHSLVAANLRYRRHDTSRRANIPARHSHRKLAELCRRLSALFRSAATCQNNSRIEALMKAAIAFSALALTACGTREPIRVNMPVPVDCVRRDQVPPETSPLGPIPQSAVQAADLLAAKLLEVRGEARTLRALVTACIGDD